MNSCEMFDIIGETPDVYLLEAANAQPKVLSVKRYSPKRVWLIAAIITLFCLLVGFTFMHYLQEMEIGKTAGTYYYVDSGKVTIGNDGGRSVITVHGLNGSPAFLAHQQWYAFTENYDVDGEKLAEAEASGFKASEAYEAYSIYNEEMKEKVDEIAEKHGLKLLGTFAPFQRWENRIFYEALGISSLLTPESEAEIKKESGYFYEAGNFHVTFNMTMAEGDDAWPYKMVNSIYYSKADVFDRVYFVTEDSTKWDTWYYTTSSGEQVLLARNGSGYGARAIYSRDDALIYVDIENYYITDYSSEIAQPEKTVFMTKQQLEEVVEQFDFSLAVEKVNMGLAKQKLSRFENATANQ